VKVLLVNPFQVEYVHKKGRIYNRTWTPLDLAYCSALLERNGIDADILDANAEQIGPDGVALRSRGYDKVFLTSTSLDRWQCPHLDLNPFFKTVAAVRTIAPEVYVMGSHGTVKPAEMIEETRADGCGDLRRKTAGADPRHHVAQGWRGGAQSRPVAGEDG
jgi:anaerobic magnesium-protoporphyrin IX monomethyl ester cyclase